MRFFGRKRIFLDYAGGKDNPSGIHREGIEARRKLETARSKVAKLLHCQVRDVIFTSGATESDNLAILGVFEAAREKIKNPHIIISHEEHPAVEESVLEAKRRGAEISVVPAEKVGEHIRADTVLVSISYASNETGAIHPVQKISRAVKEFRRKEESSYPYLHSDATQALGYLPTDIERLGVDLLTLGEALVVRQRVAIRPLLLGGGQERGLRSGTQNLESLVEYAEHIETVERDRHREFERLTKLKSLFLKEVARRIPVAVINSPKESLPNIVSLSIPGQIHEFLAVKLDERGIAVSTGSSCDSNKDEPDKEALRFSFGRETREADVKVAIRNLSEVVI